MCANICVQKVQPSVDVRTFLGAAYFSSDAVATYKKLGAGHGSACNAWPGGCDPGLPPCSPNVTFNPNGPNEASGRSAADHRERGGWPGTGSGKSMARCPSDSAHWESKGVATARADVSAQREGCQRGERIPLLDT